MITQRTKNQERRTSSSGFTLIELLVSITILAIIVTLGLSLDLGSYRRATLESERDAVVGILASARGKALGNVNQSNHGVYIASSGYILFEGSSFAARNQDKDAEFEREEDIAVSGANEIVFRALDGAVLSTGTIVFANAAREISIAVNAEGVILW